MKHNANNLFHSEEKKQEEISLVNLVLGFFVFLYRRARS